MSFPRNFPGYSDGNETGYDPRYGPSYPERNPVHDPARNRSRDSPRHLGHYEVRRSPDCNRSRVFCQIRTSGAVVDLEENRGQS